MKTGILHLLIAALFFTSACTSMRRSDLPGFRFTGKSFAGKASWYSVRTNGGTRTASGEPFRNSGATAAHKSLPFGTWVRVTNLRNDRSAIVRITDRGPYIRGRVIDVSIGTAEKLGFVKAGVVPVRVEIMERR